MKHSGVPMIIREQKLKNLVVVIVLVLESKGLYYRTSEHVKYERSQGTASSLRVC